MFDKLHSMFRRLRPHAADAPRHDQRAAGARRRRTGRRAAAAALFAALGVGSGWAAPAAAQERLDGWDGLLAGGWRGLLLPRDSLDPGFIGPVYGVPTMIGSMDGPFPTPVRIESFTPTPIFATYTGATSQFIDVTQPVVFSFQSGNPNPLLPDIAGIASTPPAVDMSGDGQPGTFRGLPEVAALTQVVQANAPAAGTVVFQSGQAVFISNTSILFQSQTLGADPAVLLPEVNGDVAAAEAADPNFNGYQLQFFYQFLRDPFTLVIPHPTSASLMGRTKISQNGSVVPRTRAFVDYAVTELEDVNGGFTFQRFTPGFERTFFGGATSVELRAPIALTADSDIAAEAPFDDGNGEFGNLSLAVKGLMIRTPRFAFSGGMQFTFPTASDTTVSLGDGTRILEVENESVHVMPFLGAVYDGNLVFSQMFVQVDIDPNGNSVRVNPTLSPDAELVVAPDLHDADQLYLDWATGLWLYRNPGEPRGPWSLVALAPTLELHYTQGLGRQEFLRVGSLQVGEARDAVERLDVVGGLSAILPGGAITAGVGAPVAGDDTHDWEFRLMLNHALR